MESVAKVLSSCTDDESSCLSQKSVRNILKTVKGKRTGPCTAVVGSFDNGRLVPELVRRKSTTLFVDKQTSDLHTGTTGQVLECR